MYIETHSDTPPETHTLSPEKMIGRFISLNWYSENEDSMNGFVEGKVPYYIGVASRVDFNLLYFLIFLF